ncbi:BMP family ABC transporter substrate-binding protein [Bacillus sp. CLL-7-23]|uniref:BMP family ABC transporter substrate-binding protein n=1 Tax=Bacillus changyiensis TaxID=3004103 RepID=A0ABT4X1X4_9BACI|nr:BMP family ABC transporter substrate-binding protein [Bacillus changyiensis]MDA7026082.1 BMP family ABC transporter substrate-binding protein [Bacillus changyiensis]
MVYRLIMIFLLIFVLGACEHAPLNGKIEKVGMLVPDTISDQVWGTIGYKGLLQIQSSFNADVYYKERIDNEAAIKLAVKDFDKKKVNLIFGHGSEYEKVFNEICKQYPDIHFVLVNGRADHDNVTSIDFNGEAMGFFGGMTAAQKSHTKKIGVLATHRWQPEIKGFIEGAKYVNSNIEVVTMYVGQWDDSEKAMKLYQKMKKAGVDVVYPAGDRYNVPVIEQIKKDGLFAIGYISDQSDLGNNIVLTSTVQHVDEAYELIASKFDQGTLTGGRQRFDFQDGVIEIGRFSPLINQSFREKVSGLIEDYKKTGKLPNKT